MSEIYNPDTPPYQVDPDAGAMANWVFNELQRVSEAMLASQTVKDFLPLSVQPEKFQDGSVVYFDQSASGNVNEVTGAGLHVFREGLWRRLVEE